MSQRWMRVSGVWVSMVAAAVFGSSAFAAPASVGPVRLEIPAGFLGTPPQVQKDLRVAGWVSTEGNSKTLLQVTVYDFGSQLSAEPSEKELAAAAEKYLGDFLKGVERRRTGYSQTPVEHVTLAGLPATRSTWKGAAGSIPAVGVMYCVIVKKHFVVSLHTQDVGSAPTAGMQKAIEAFEAMRIVQ